MKKHFFISALIALTGILIYIPVLAASAEHLNMTAVSTEPIQGITTNKVHFETVSSQNIPSQLTKKIDMYKNNYNKEKGFLVYNDTASGYSYIAIMRGLTPTSGYGINVNSVEDIEGRLTIHITEIDPNKEDMTLQVLSYPYTIIKVSNNNIGYMINVITSFNYAYKYYDFPEEFKIGASFGTGIFKNAYEENNFTFIEIQYDNESDSRLFYVDSSNIDLKNQINSLKNGSQLTILSTTGTPKTTKGKVASPLSKILTSIDKNEFTQSYWRDLKYSNQVNINKAFLVTFASSIKPQNVNNSNIYVTDSNGVQIPLDISLAETDKVLKVSLAQDYYKAGQTYYLFISTNTFNKAYLSSYKGYRLKFQTAEGFIR